MTWSLFVVLAQRFGTLSRGRSHRSASGHRNPFRVA